MKWRLVFCNNFLFKAIHFFQGKLESHAEYLRISEEVYKDLEDREADNSLDADTLTQAFLLERNRLQKIKHEDEVLFS